MRLTPSRFRSSHSSSDECSADTDESLAVTIHYAPSRNTAPGDPSDRTTSASEFVPESDAVLVSELESMSLPATVDEVADQLIRPSNPPVETWGNIHECLHRDRLPSLADDGAVEFDTQNGVVNLDTDRPGGIGLTRPVLGALSIGLLFSVVAVLTSVVTALTLTLLLATVFLFV